MTENKQTIVSFAREIICVNSCDPLKKIYTLMCFKGISTVPVIEHDGYKNIGVYRRKTIFN